MYWHYRFIAHRAQTNEPILLLCVKHLQLDLLHKLLNFAANCIEKQQNAVGFILTMVLAWLFDSFVKVGEGFRHAVIYWDHVNDATTATNM